VSDVTWNVCAYPNPADGCSQWRFERNGQVEALVNGSVVWTGKWARLDHYVYKYEFSYMGKDNLTWVRFSDPRGVGHATDLIAYPSADMTSPYRKGQLAGSPQTTGVTKPSQPPTVVQPPTGNCGCKANMANYQMCLTLCKHQVNTPPTGPTLQPPPPTASPPKHYCPPGAECAMPSDKE
jgi:hypothetical protein